MGSVSGSKSPRIPKKEVQGLHLWQAGNPKDSTFIRHLPKSLERNSQCQGHSCERVPFLGRLTSRGRSLALGCQRTGWLLHNICIYMVFTVNNRKHFLYLPNCSCFCRQVYANYYWALHWEQSWQCYWHNCNLRSQQETRWQAKGLHQKMMFAF